MSSKHILLTLALSLVCAGLCAQNLKSFKPGEIWPDNNGTFINAHGGGIILHKGVYYWFGEHKTEGEEGNKAHVGVHCYSSKDLYNWKDEGIALSVSHEPGSDIEEGCILERPKVLYNKKTRKFVMWFHLEPKGKGYDGAMIGIASADKICGPYTYIRCTRSTPGMWPVNIPPSYKEKDHPKDADKLVEDFEKGQQSRDMTLFLDDDGKAYHICSSEGNRVVHIAELTDDFLDFSGKYVRAFPGSYIEAQAIFKKDGLYYMMGSGCTGWAPNPAHSAVAPSIWGPWTELGNPCPDEGKETTYQSQSTWFLPVKGKKDAYIYMGDRWRPGNAIDGRYIWLPVEFEGDGFVIHWKDEWSLDFFDRK